MRHAVKVLDPILKLLSRIFIVGFVLLVLLAMFLPALSSTGNISSKARRAFRSPNASLDERLSAARKLVPVGTSARYADAILVGGISNLVQNSASPESGTCKYDFTEGYILLTFTNDACANVEAFPRCVSGGARSQN